MEIKVLKTTRAASCPKGIGSKEYVEGEIYNIFDELAEVFISEGWGEKVEKEAPKKVELEDKAIKKSPEDKAVKASKETKEKKASKPKAKAKKADK